MANITLGQLRDLWKNVSDWVTGVATHEPKVQLSGSFVPDEQALPVRPMGSLPGVRPPEIETILNAVSVPPGGDTGFTLIDFKGCRKALLAVACDQPWRMENNSLWTNVPHTGIHLYPNTVSSEDQSPVTSINYPKVIVVGAYIGSSDSTVTSYETALARAELPANFRGNIYNQSENTATITLRVMRIW